MQRANSQESGGEGDSAEVLAARAQRLGRDVGVSAPDLDRLREAFVELAMGSDEEWRSFTDAFVDSAESAYGQEWADILEAAVAEESAAPAPYFSMDRPLVRGASEAWSEEVDPSAVWGHGGSRGPMTGSSLWQLSLPLLEIDTSVALRALEHLPYPLPLVDVLGMHVRYDPNKVIGLIEAADPAFDTDGRWLDDRPIAALVATDLIVRDARDRVIRARTEPPLVDEPPQTGDLERFQIGGDELPAWLERAFRAVLSRDDGASIALRYLTHLTRAAILGVGHNGVVRLAAQALASVLRVASIGVREARAVWELTEELPPTSDGIAEDRIPGSTKRSESEGEGGRRLKSDGLPALLGALTVMGEAPSGGDVADAWSWFETLLKDRDPGLFLAGPSLGSQRDARAECVARLSSAFARLPDVSSRIRQAYSVLQPQRRRLQYRRRYEDLDMDRPSVLLLRVAVAMSERLAALGDLEPARELLLWTFERARRLWLIQPLHVHHERVHLVAECFAAVPTVYASDPGEALKFMVPPIAGAPVMLANAAWMLARHSGTPGGVPEHIGRVGGDVASAFQEVRELDHARERYGLMFDDPAELASYIGISLAPVGD